MLLNSEHINLYFVKQKINLVPIGEEITESG